MATGHLAGLALFSHEGIFSETFGITRSQSQKQSRTLKELQTDGMEKNERHWWSCKARKPLLDKHLHPVATNSEDGRSETKSANIAIKQHLIEVTGIILSKGVSS